MATFSNETNVEEFLASGKKTILFLHDKKSVEKVVPFKSFLDGKICVIIPTSPDALLALDALKIPYEIPENYYLEEEYCDYFKKVEQKIFSFAKHIDAALREHYPNIKQTGLQPAFYSLYSFERMYHPLADVYFKTIKIIDKERPEKIVIFSQKKEIVGTADGMKSWPLWDAKENIFKKILESRQISLPVHEFLSQEDRGIDKKTKDIFMAGIGKYIQKNPQLYYFFKMLNRDWRLAVLMVFSRLSKKAPLLLLNNGYDWDLCHKELKEKGYYIWGQINDNLENWQQKSNQGDMLFEKVNGLLKNDASFRENLTEKDIDFYPILKDGIEFFLKKTVPALLSAYEKTIQLIKKRKLKAVLFSVNPTAISKSIAHAARQSGIVVIGWQHGDMNYRPSYSIVQNDLSVCDMFLSWGSGASENRMAIAEKSGLEYRTKIAGSAGLDRLLFSPAQEDCNALQKIGIKNTAEPVIVYAATMYYLGNSYYFSRMPWSDNHVYATQKKIIERMADFGGTKIIKLHPNLFYALPALDEYCRSLEKQNVWTVRGGVFTPLLFSVADAVIIDIPSTTLLQAIACKKPVFCLTRHLKLEDDAMEMLKKRAVVAEEPEILMGEVEYFLKSGDYKADLHNNEFLENYGTNTDGQADKRAATVVDELVKSYYVQKKNY